MVPVLLSPHSSPFLNSRLGSLTSVRGPHKSSSGPGEGTTDDFAIPVGHLIDALGQMLALCITPFHVERLILRLAIARNLHHIAQGDCVLARVVKRRNTRGWEEFGHSERLQALR